MARLTQVHERGGERLGRAAVGGNEILVVVDDALGARCVGRHTHLACLHESEWMENTFHPILDIGSLASSNVQHVTQFHGRQQPCANPP